MTQKEKLQELNEDLEVAYNFSREQARTIQRHIREFEVMRSSVVEAMVRLPNVQEYIAQLEKEICLLRRCLTDVLHCVKLFLDTDK